MKSYKELLGNDPLAEAILGVVNEDNTNDKSDDGEGLDKVQPKALKKKFKDRKDKDIDNDGDVDDSDKFIDKKRKAISKAIAANEDVDKADETPAGDDTEDEAPKKKKKKKDGEKDTPTTKDTGEEPIDVDPKLDEEAIKDSIFLELNLEHYTDTYGYRAQDVMESVTEKLFEKLTPDQKKKKDAYLKKDGGRVQDKNPYVDNNMLRDKKKNDPEGQKKTVDREKHSQHSKGQRTQTLDQLRNRISTLRSKVKDNNASSSEKNELKQAENMYARKKKTSQERERSKAGYGGPVEPNNSNTKDLE
jgi:hypothetical protein